MKSEWETFNVGPVDEPEENLSQDTYFRHHRHDVMNFLQVIRAYMQLGRPEAATRTVDTLADWLKSLSLWQKIWPGRPDLMWQASVCPRVILRNVLNERDLTGEEGAALGLAWRWLDEQSNLHAGHMDVDLIFSQDRTGSTSWLTVGIHPGEEILSWWNTSGVVHTEHRDFKGIHIQVLPVL